jgi:hypothetical protein
MALDDHIRSAAGRVAYNDDLPIWIRRLTLEAMHDAAPEELRAEISGYCEMALMQEEALIMIAFDHRRASAN